MVGFGEVGTTAKTWGTRTKPYSRQQGPMERQRNREMGRLQSKNSAPEDWSPRTRSWLHPVNAISRSAAWMFIGFEFAVFDPGLICDLSRDMRGTTSRTFAARPRYVFANPPLPPIGRSAMHRTQTHGRGLSQPSRRNMVHSRSLRTHCLPLRSH